MKTLIKGIVNRNTIFNEKQVLFLSVDAPELERIEKLINDEFGENYTGCPIKYDDNGNCYIKATSGYDIAMYEKTIPGTIKIDDVGVGSEVTMQVNLKATKFQRNTYIIAYLLAVNVHNLVDPVYENPFL